VGYVEHIQNLDEISVNGVAAQEPYQAYGDKLLGSHKTKDRQVLNVLKKQKVRPWVWTCLLIYFVNEGENHQRKGVRFLRWTDTRLTIQP
jgi:hypothetical protein